MYAQTINLFKRYKVKYAVGPGSELCVPCPRCQLAGRKFEDNKLYVNHSLNVFHCKRCDWRGGTATLAEFYRQVYTETGDRYATLAEPMPTFDDLYKWMEVVDEPYERSRASESLIPPGTVLAWESQLAREYLRSRNIEQSQCEHFGLLYCPEGYFGRRVLFPICDYFGEYKTFVARAIDPDAEKKYLFPKGCKTSTLLYNIHNITLRGNGRHRPVWITEGVFDAIHCSPLAVATFGKHITDSQVRLLRKLGPSYVVLLWDWDAWHETPELWNKVVWTIGQHLDVYGVKLPEPNTDPTNYSLPELYKLVREARK
jgi:hypothetical protein